MTDKKEQVNVERVPLNDGLGMPAYTVSEYDSSQWWFKELEKIWELKIEGQITADMKRAAHVACSLMRAIEHERKNMPNDKLRSE